MNRASLGSIVTGVAIGLGISGLAITPGMMFPSWLNGAGTPVSGPANQKCDAGLAPSDPTQPADNCGVESLKIKRPIFHDHLKRLEADLYIDNSGGGTTCVVGPFGCLMNDNRPFVKKDSPDPHADPSRNRANLVFDFESGEVTAIIDPSCRIHPLGFGGDNQKECFAPKQVGQGTTFDVTSNTMNARAWTIDIQAKMVQTDYPSVFGLAQLDNDWHISVNPLTDEYSLTGSGSNFPDLGVIADNKVQCAYQGTRPTDLLINSSRDYHCNGVIPASSPSQNQTTSPPSQPPGSPSPSPLPTSAPVTASPAAQATVVKTFEPWVAAGQNGGSAPRPGLMVTNGGTGTCDSGSADDPGAAVAVRCTPPGNGTPCYINDIGGGGPGSPLLCSSDPTSNQVIEVTPSGAIPAGMLNPGDPSQPPWFLILADGRKCHLLGYGTNTNGLGYDCGNNVGATVPDRSQPTWTVQEGQLQANPAPSPARVAVVTAYRGKTAVATPPASPTPAPATTSPATAVVQDYYAAINKHDYQEAWSLGGKNLSGSYDSFVQGFANTAHDSITVASLGDNTVIILIDSTQTDGTHEYFTGSYTVQNNEIASADVRAR